VDALVLVGDVEEAAPGGDRDALYARQGRELADELGGKRAGVRVGRENGAKVGRDGVVAARVVAYEDAPFVAAVHVAGYEVQLLAFGGAQEPEITYSGDVALAAAASTTQKPRTSGGSSPGSKRRSMPSSSTRTGRPSWATGKRRPNRSVPLSRKAAPSMLIG
jgi:hypothetical protein